MEMTLNERDGDKYSYKYNERDECE